MILIYSLLEIVLMGLPYSSLVSTVVGTTERSKRRARNGTAMVDPRLKMSKKKSVGRKKGHVRKEK